MISIREKKELAYTKGSIWLSSWAGYKFMVDKVFKPLNIDVPNIRIEENEFVIEGTEDQFRNALNYILQYKEIVKTDKNGKEIIKVKKNGEKKINIVPCFYECLPIDDKLKIFFGKQEISRTNHATVIPKYVNNNEYIEEIIVNLNKNKLIDCSLDIFPGKYKNTPDGIRNKINAKDKFLLQFWKFVSIPFVLTSKDNYETVFCIFSMIDIEEFVNNFYDFLTSFDTKYSESGNPLSLFVNSSEESLLKSSEFIISSITKSNKNNDKSIIDDNIFICDGYHYQGARIPTILKTHEFRIDKNKIRKYSAISKEYYNNDFKNLLIYNIFQEKDLANGIEKRIFMHNKFNDIVDKFRTSFKKYIEDRKGRSMADKEKDTTKILECMLNNVLYSKTISCSSNNKLKSDRRNKEIEKFFYKFRRVNPSYVKNNLFKELYPFGQHGGINMETKETFNTVTREDYDFLHEKLEEDPKKIQRDLMFVLVAITSYKEKNNESNIKVN